MKSILNLPIIIIMMLLSFPIDIIAGNPYQSYTVTLHRQPSNMDENGKHEWDIDPEGHRLPSRPIECTISQDSGVTIYDCPDEIVSYEIWDADGNTCLSLCTDESDFLNDLFSLTGDFQIRLKTSDYTYIGYLSTSEMH